MAKSKFWSDFRSFALKGNVIDMAVGVIIGGAFSKIVTSLVKDLLMPCLGACIGGFNFSDLKLVLTPAELNETGEIIKEAVTINYGNFLQTTVDFLIIALCVFMTIRVVIKSLEKIRKKEEAKPAPAPKKTDDVLLLEEIRDLLKEKK